MPEGNSLLRKKLKKVEKKNLSKVLKKFPEKNVTNKNINRVYTPLGQKKFSYLKKIGFPGEYPFTRGIYPTMYRSKLWTMREFSGFGTASDTNKRFKYLLDSGITGLSVAFDLPTLMGRDSDYKLSKGEVGKCGVAVDSLADMETIFNGIPLNKITTSMTINGPAIILFAMYLTVAEKQGVDFRELKGTIQNDILKEYIAQKTYIFPPGESIRLITDIFKYTIKHVPDWHPISISGYHIREAGSTAVQELAFTLYDGITYVEEAKKAGIDVNDILPKLSFFFNSHNDFFEEIAKFRAGRRIWAREIKKRFKPKDKKSLRLRFHAQTSGVALTSQQPYNNVIRVTLQALASVLGGAQSLHTNSLDEALGLPTEGAVTLALRTQQIIAYETGVINTVDPLGGSYYLESLTDKIEDEVYKYFEKIDKLGGMISAIEKGFPQREITLTSLKYQRDIESRKKIIVGVNDFTRGIEPVPEILKIKKDIEEKQIEKLHRLRKNRDNKKVAKTLKNLSSAANSKENLVGFILNAVKSYATIGEICDTLRNVFGEYHEEPQI